MSTKIDDLLKTAVNSGASDLHLKVGNFPVLRIDGALSFIPDEKKITAEDVEEISTIVLNENQQQVFKRKNELDISYSVAGLGRVRCNIFRQRGSIGFAFRVIPIKILDIEQLHLPIVLREIALEPRGLILVTGTTGSGKSTTLASMIDYVNQRRTEHIMTIEDPIEFLHRDKSSILNQREVGADTESFSKAIRSAMRQDPDVILVGEMRDFETIHTAITAAETGHLVLSTLHTVDATETINRIISVFPPYQHKQIRVQLASVLRAVISMRLIPRSDGKGRVPAVEVMRATGAISECIEDPNRTKFIPDYIKRGHSQYGMQSFDQSLLSLFKDEHITYEEALRRATSPDDFALKVKGVQSTEELREEEEESIKSKDEPKIQRFSK
ncbi:type IV pilus twitching motility protein PilT [bacterium]|nr:MAG: type IV pilus twitching motility protein PilT [bacterium]